MGQDNSKIEKVEGKARAIHFLQGKQGNSNEKSQQLFNSKGDVIPLDTTPGSPRPPTPLLPPTTHSFLSSSTISNTVSPRPVKRINVQKTRGYFSTPSSKRPTPTPSKLPSPKRVPVPRQPSLPRSSFLRPQIRLKTNVQVAEDAEFTDNSNREGPFLTDESQGRCHALRTSHTNNSFKLLRRKAGDLSVSAEGSEATSPNGHSQLSLSMCKEARSSATLLLLKQRKKVVTGYSEGTGIVPVLREKTTLRGKFVIRRKKEEAKLTPVKIDHSRRKPGSRSEYEWRWKGHHGVEGHPKGKDGKKTTAIAKQ